MEAHSAKQSNKKEVLRVDFNIYENVVYGKVLMQEESLRSTFEGRFQKDVGTVNTKETGFFTIMSCINPRLQDNILFIRGGRKDQDGQCFSHAYHNKEEAEYAVSQFRSIISKVNNEQ